MQIQGWAGGQPLFLFIFLLKHNANATLSEINELINTGSYTQDSRGNSGNV